MPQLDTGAPARPGKAVFLDRDGVLNDNSRHYYIHRPDQWAYNPGIVEGLRRLQSLGYALMLVTNQGGVARGLYTLADVDALHRHVADDLARQGVAITDIAVCPHHDSLCNCLCRKPKPLMIERLAAKHGVDLGRSWMVGDSSGDIEAGRAAGLRTLRVPANADIRQHLLAIE